MPWHQRGDGEAKKIDFKPLLKEITWKNPDSSAPAFSALVPLQGAAQHG